MPGAIKLKRWINSIYLAKFELVLRFRKSGQQFANETTELIERTRSRNNSRMADSPPRPHQPNDDDSHPVEVQGKSLSPTRRMSVQEQDLQPSIGHTYYNNRSPSPKRPMTSRPVSRSYSRNAMTQVDQNYLGSPIKSIKGRDSPPNRHYLEISGQEGRAASRAEILKYSKTTPNLSDYNDNQPKYEYQNNDNGGPPSRRMSFSRHFEPQHQRGRTNGYHQPEPSDLSPSEPGIRSLRASNSLQLLPLARDAYQPSFRDQNRYHRPGSDWNLTTTKRAYRYEFLIFIYYEGLLFDIHAFLKSMKNKIYLFRYQYYWFSNGKIFNIIS